MSLEISQLDPSLASVITKQMLFQMELLLKDEYKLKQTFRKLSGSHQQCTLHKSFLIRISFSEANSALHSAM
jgi:hypothetical protein